MLLNVTKISRLRRLFSHSTAKSKTRVRNLEQKQILGQYSQFFEPTPALYKLKQNIKFSEKTGKGNAITYNNIRNELKLKALCLILTVWLYGLTYCYNYAFDQAFNFRLK